MGDEKSLAHTRWNCKYHIVFAPKYRRQTFYGEKRRAVGSILRKLCEWKNVRILEAECCTDHIHMLLELPPKMSVSSFMGYLKGKSSLMLYEQFGNLKFKYRNREFWCRGYYVDTVGKNTAKIPVKVKLFPRCRPPALYRIRRKSCWRSGLIRNRRKASCYVRNAVDGSMRDIPAGLNPSRAPAAGSSRMIRTT